NEVDEAHPLSRMKHSLAQQGLAVAEILLEPLGETSVHQFIADTLRLPLADVAELARNLYQKTQGNPFFLCRYLTQLHEDGDIYFNHERCRWCWDDQRIASLRLADNVVELLGKKIHLYP